MERGASPDLSCRELVELVTDYLEGGLPAPERARFDAHLQECEACRAYVEQMRASVRLTGAAGRAQEVPGMDALLQGFRGYRRRL
jgi:anti-sigma factor RsiW